MRREKGEKGDEKSEKGEERDEKIREGKWEKREHFYKGEWRREKVNKGKVEGKTKGGRRFRRRGRRAWENEYQTV